MSNNCDVEIAHRERKAISQAQTNFFSRMLLRRFASFVSSHTIEFQLVSSLKLVGKKKTSSLRKLISISFVSDVESAGKCFTAERSLGKIRGKFRPCLRPPTLGSVWCRSSLLVFLWKFCEISLQLFSEFILYVYVFLLMTILLKYPKKCARQRQSRHTRKFSISPQPPARLVSVATRPCSSGKSSSTLEGDGKWEKDLESARVILIPSTEWELPLSKNENNLLFEPRHGEIMSKCCSTISSSSWNVLLNILQLRNLRLCLDKWRTGLESTWRAGRAHSSQFFILISAGDNTCTTSVCVLELLVNKRRLTNV